MSQQSMKISVAEASYVYEVILLASFLLSVSALPLEGQAPIRIQQVLKGTCIGAGHTSGCCFPGQGSDCSVELANGNSCHCDANCHKFNDCCSDIQLIRCFREPETCSAAGFSSGCCNSDTQNCYVPGGRCYCDETCHKHGDCCTDIATIGCAPKTCATAGRKPGNCVHNCFVPGGSCHCDSLCCKPHHNDCCDDVNVTMICPTAVNVEGQSRGRYRSRHPLPSRSSFGKSVNVYREDSMSHQPNLNVNTQSRPQPVHWPRATGNMRSSTTSLREQEETLQRLANEIEALQKQNNDHQH